MTQQLNYKTMVRSEISLKKRPRRNTALIVPVFKQKKLLANFLDHIAKQTLPSDIIIVDNSSENDIVRELSSRDEEIVVITMNSNYGSAGGFYAGLHYALSSYYEMFVLVDSDTIPLSANLLEREFEELGLENVSYVMPTNVMFRSVPGLIERLEVDGDFPALFIGTKREVLLKSGITDPCYFYSFEDSDLCLRMKRFGRPKLLKDVYCMHHLLSYDLRYLYPIYLARNYFIFFSRLGLRKKGIEEAVRVNLSNLVASSISKDIRVVYASFIGLLNFLTSPLGFVPYRGPISLSSLDGRLLTIFDLITNQKQCISTIRLDQIEADGTIDYRLVRPFGLLTARDGQAYVKSWDEAAVANLNPHVRTVFVAGFDPFLVRPIWSVFRSNLRDKLGAWIKLVANLPLYVIFVPLVILACKKFRDHPKDIHE